MSTASNTIKKRWDIVGLVTAALIVATMAGGLFIGANAIRLYNDMRTTWRHYDTVSAEKVQYLTQIHVYLGFSGLTKNLKNYLLYNKKYLLTWIDIDLDQAKNSIDSYSLLDVNADEKKALQTLRTLVLNVRKQIRTIPRLRAHGMTPAQIDTAINLNTAAAAAALDKLRWAWRAQASKAEVTMNEASTKGTALVRMGWMFLPVMILIGVIVFWLIRRLYKQIAAYEHEKAALQESEQKFRDMAANVPGVIFQWYGRQNGERGYLYVSPRCQELYGVSPDELKRDWQALSLHPDDRERYFETINDAFEKRSEWSFEGRLLTPSGEEKWWRGISKPFPLGNNEVVFNGVMVDISLQKQMEEKLRLLATTDPLTGIINRRHFLHKAEEEIARAHRYQKPMSFLMLDLDKFKSVNDTYGHPCGDEVLRRFVTTTQEFLRTTDVFARFGGEEFAILLPETDIPGAVILAERICVGIENMDVEWRDEALHITVSMGLAQLGPDDKTIHSIVTRADKALYTAKAEGRNRVVISDGDITLSSKSAPELIELTTTEPGVHGAN